MGEARLGWNLLHITRSDWLTDPDAGRTTWASAVTVSVMRPLLKERRFGAVMRQASEGEFCVGNIHWKYERRDKAIRSIISCLFREEKGLEYKVGKAKGRLEGSLILTTPPGSRPGKWLHSHRRASLRKTN